MGTEGALYNGREINPNGAYPGWHNAGTLVHHQTQQHQPPQHHHQLQHQLQHHHQIQHHHHWPQQPQCKYDITPPPPPPPKRYLITTSDVVSGKGCGKESPDKKDDGTELWNNVEAQAAFLGPNLWEKTLPYDTDLKYVDLDEFLSENGIPVEGGAGLGASGSAPKEPAAGGRLSPQPNLQHQQPSATTTTHVLTAAAVVVPPPTKRERSPTPPPDTMSPLAINPPSPADSTMSFASSSRDFDPRTRVFSDEELKPQPMVKKSRKQNDPYSSYHGNHTKQFVPEGLKDEKYWARRRKNNMAAKRSRDARRMKENQIALRAGFLEKENLGLRQEMDRLKKENMALRDRLSKFTEI